METTQATSLPSELRKRAQESLYFTATALLGFNKLTPHLHYEMCKTAEQAEHLHWLLTLVPRNHYKTTIDTISYPVWRALRNPNETGLIIANTARNAARFGTRIRNAFERAPFIRQLFPELRPELSDQWNKDYLCLPRTADWPEPTFSTAGWDTKVTSGHYDWIIFDDLVDEETYEQPELMTKLTARFEQRIGGLLRPPVHERTVMVVMNHWSMIDLGCYILERHPEFRVYYRQAIEGGKPIFPEAYTLEWLLAKQKSDPYTFANQYMNNPVDRSITENKLEWLQMYKRDVNSLVLPEQYDKEEVPLGHLNIYAAGDPRHSLSTTYTQKLTSRNAIVVSGIDARGRRYALDEYAARDAPEDFLRKMLEMHRKWHPVKFGIESYGYQAVLEPLSKLIWKDEPDKPFLELLPRDTTRSKEQRIRGGYRFFAEGSAFSHHLLPGFNEEYLTFSVGKTRDLGDCWAWCMHMMQEPASDDDYADEARVDRDHLDSLHPVTGV